MELVCLSKGGDPRVLTSLEASQRPKEGGQFKTHCKRESLPKAVVFGYPKYFLRGHLF